MTKGAIQIAPYSPPGTEALGESAWDVIGENGTACILQSHGILAVGGSLGHAMHVAFAMEDAAKIAIYAQMISDDVRPFTDDDYKAMYEAYMSKK